VPELTHVDAAGNARMVDVSEKPPTKREAVATGWIVASAEALEAVVQRASKKGDVLTVAQIAGISGAKKTSELIPLCHPLPLSSVRVELAVEPDRIRVTATAATVGPTGVEMEALTAVSTALLTVYDMLKAVDRTMEIGGIHLVAKSGGRSGDWKRA
jgi:cyclic pyranopterin monophosphate synthase